LKEKHPSAAMMWFQNGKLWPSRIDAQEAMRARGEMGRRGDKRQDGGFRSRDREFKTSRPQDLRTSRSKPEWRPKTSTFAKAPADKQDSRPKASSSEKLDWKPKGEFTPAPKRSERPDWKRKGSFDRDSKPRSFARPAFKPSGDDSRSAKPEWKPKGSFDRKAEWKPKGPVDRDRKPAWRPKTQDSRPRTSRSEKLEWKPKTESGTGGREPGAGSREPGAGSREPGAAEKRKWVPKAEYKKSQGIEAKRDSKWRPGGEHRDPRQKYKDAKKTKWTKFKKTIRTRWEAKTKKKS
jgi:hypothetical protein